MRKFLLCCIFLFSAIVASAQVDEPGAEVLSYDSIVSDEINADAIFDWWFIDAQEGDEMVVDMQGSDGLAPLLGLLDPNGTLVTRSDDGVADGSVTLDYTIPADGQYVIVATRAGNENGTTTGSYQLRVRRANGPVTRVNPYQEVIFRCNDMQVTNTAILEFYDDSDQVSAYRINVYGVGDFVPVIRVELDNLNVTDCSSDSQAMGGDSYTLPGQDTITLEGDLLEHAAQLTITGAKQAGTVLLTIGSRDGVPGQYVAVIEGFYIDPANDRDTLRVGQGPLAASAPLLVYMVGGKNERLDPAIALEEENEPDDSQASTAIVCDDAGRRDCDQVPSVAGLQVMIGEDVEIQGDRFDAGALLPAGDPSLRPLVLSSFSGNTSGSYSLVLIGELPPRE
ncbi:MAG: hypothetical protein K8L99_22945 [Anaerolineae bacterium]|nr:hypothetical protein [Anaerolineae bacterium]